MNKRIISLLLALVMSLSLTACGKTIPAVSKADGEKITLTLGVKGMASTAEMTQQVSTMVAGGEKLPDDYFNISDEVKDIYGQDGYLYDIAPFFTEEHMEKPEAKYVDNIHSLGWDDAIAASQSAWDRMNGK